MCNSMINGVVFVFTEILTGKYQEDFESGEDSDEINSSGSECTNYTSQQRQKNPVVSSIPVNFINIVSYFSAWCHIFQHCVIFL